MRKISLLALAIVSCSLAIAQQSLNNDAIIKLAKAGLSDDVIVSTINASPGIYNTSADGIVALKQAGVSDKVISAVVLKNSGSVPTSSNTATAPSLPTGIDDVGVYYLDKNGVWVPLMPEVVNFKTGGVMKNIASMGMVKGDINGHINGAKSKQILTFPAKLAVYVPEGVAITEYQLLHLHPNSDSREFRSVTGGVLHVSGGATRDLVEFQSIKLAPRVYQITLEPSLGKGEFGLLPPGAVGSSNLGSSGKIYSVSIPE